MPLLRLDRVHKSFSGVQALKPITLEVADGDVLGLIGENGAGKSTLIKVLSGVHVPDGGRIEWRGASSRFRSPHEAMLAGIATIHQELSYCGLLSVAENMLLGEPWPRRRWGGVDWPGLHEEARRRLDRFGLDIPTHAPFHVLSPAEKQEAAIARALSREARLLILDEPTASLSEPEVERLFAHLDRLRRHGVAIIYVSHRLDEVLRLTDRVAVLRDGELAATYPTREAGIDRMVRDMVGRAVALRERHARAGAAGSAVLEVEEASREGMFRNVTLRVHSGEIVALAGLVGAGRSELARAVFGLYPLDAGSMRLHGRPWRPRGPADALRAGLVYVPEERKRQALVLGHSLGETLSLGFSDLIARFGWIPRREEAARVRRAIDRFAIKARGPGQAVGTLSGGNQQKAVLARWLERDPAVIILDEPTRGVDVGAKAEIHGLIERLRDGGKAVLLISSDLPEVLALADRVVVLCRGEVAGELRGPQITQENVIRAASGLGTGAPGAAPAGGAA